MVLLHGNLRVEILEGKELLEGLGVLERFGQGCCRVSGPVPISPYVTVRVGIFSRVIKTGAVENTDQPVWNHRADVPVADDIHRIIIHVKSLNSAKNSCIGVKYKPNKSLGFLYIKTEDLLDGNNLDGWFPLTGRLGSASGTKKGSIHVRISYVDQAEALASGHLPEYYWEERVGCRVRLYQDAHLPKPMLPPSVIPEEPNQCWVDLVAALHGAKHFILITGWSVYTETPLLRGSDRTSLGELLKSRANDGVKVLVMVWDEILSRDKGPMSSGIMMTHDEETSEYFAGTGVVVGKTPRVDGDATWVGKMAVQGIFTHHQKTVIVDAPVPRSSKRTLVSFVGGLDLCDGRWDTPEHPLFTSLGKEHPEVDFHQACVKASFRVGPREPWHDIHSRVEGPAAWDVMENFIERWNCQVTEHVDLLPNLSPEIFISAQQDAVRLRELSDTWNVQVLRSIDSRSVQFRANHSGLIDKKGRLVDRSIQDAYIQHIRSAKNFIYIENQYFLGSSQSWVQEASDDAPHLVPVEIALKIVNKIRARERFAVYVAIPMYPEGPPADNAVQEILHFQFRTVEMIYSKIVDAIRETGIDAHPQDYFNVFCLGKREPPVEPIPESSPNDPVLTEDEVTLQRTRRFMIYIHSKYMCVDDAVSIVGSANINQRSMDGARDTEIAVAVRQEQFEAALGTSPKGAVAAHRKSLWAEHLGEYSPLFDEPWSVDCVRMVRQMADANWRDYCKEEFVDLSTRHLLSYPYLVDIDGTVSARQQYLPDTKASILGKDTLLPNLLTT
uniref:phospholipase D n=1 Tax=Compsopogon caeruleus TaxID=31354 RepID=A0A7S1TGW9_9RHOD